MSMFMDEDLTTDAIPSPPRDEPNEDFPQNLEKEPLPPKSSTTHKAKSKGFQTKTKRGATAYAHVVNVSNASNVHVGNYNVYNMNNPKKSQEKPQVVTPAIQKLLSSEIPVNRNHIVVVAPHLNEEWRNTARKLGFSEGQISQFFEDFNRSGVKEVIIQILLDWMQNDGPCATVGRLATALWESGQEDSVKRWSEKFD